MFRKYYTNTNDLKQTRFNFCKRHNFFNLGKTQRDDTPNVSSQITCVVPYIKKEGAINAWPC